MLRMLPASAPASDASARSFVPTPAACNGCPHGHRQWPANMVPEGARNKVLVELVTSGTPPEPMYLPKARTGIDLVDGPHEAIDPGWADFAQIEDPSERAFALVMNNQAPVCECARRLMESASHEDTTYSLAIKMRLLEPISDVSSPPGDHRPPQDVRRRVKKAKLPRGKQNAWADFGIEL